MMPSSQWKNVLRGKRLLIFDFDGTVADTTPLHAEAFHHVLSPQGIAVDYGRIAGLKTKDAIRQCGLEANMQWDEGRIDSLARLKQDHVRRAIGKGLRPLPGVDGFLHTVRGQFKLAMVTSGSRGTIDLSLKMLGYCGFFDPVICAEDVINAKPAPDGFLKCLEATKVESVEALVFEDSQAGFASARAAGIDVMDARRLWGE